MKSDFTCLLGTWLKGGVGRDLLEGVWIKGHDVQFDSDFNDSGWGGKRLI